MEIYKNRGLKAGGYKNGEIAVFVSLYIDQVVEI